MPPEKSHFGSAKMALTRSSFFASGTRAAWLSGFPPQNEQFITYTHHGAALSADDPADQRRRFFIARRKRDRVHPGVLQRLAPSTLRSVLSTSLAESSSLRVSAKTR